MSFAWFTPVIVTGFSKQLDVEDMPPLIFGDTTAATFERAVMLASTNAASASASSSSSSSSSEGGSDDDDDDAFRLVLNHMIDSTDKKKQRPFSEGGSKCSSSFSPFSSFSSSSSSSYLRLWRLGARTSPWEFYSGACFQIGAVVCQFLPSIAIHVILGEISATATDDDVGGDDDGDNSSASSSSSSPTPSAVAALVLLGAAPLLLGICDTQRMARGKRVGIRVQCLLNVRPSVLPSCRELNCLSILFPEFEHV